MVAIKAHFYFYIMIYPDCHVLPTTYNGIKYRSRTEARWAKFFDEAGIVFSYEVEGFDLPSGRYLPDFEIYPYFPYVGSKSSKIYIEVKGWFSDDEILKCKHLCEYTKCTVLMLDGVPDFKTYKLFHWNEELDCKNLSHCSLKTFDPTICECTHVYMACESEAILCTSDCKHFPLFYYPGFEDKDGRFKPSDWYDPHKDAIHAAQNERFGVYQ
jgi:hypothetical protein